jgi:hypothetical protein
MREKQSWRLMIAEFEGRGGISHVSLRCVREQAETREPTQGVDGKAKEQEF